MSDPRKLRVLFIASEADPLVKIGGLGDVAGSLPAALKTLSLSDFNDRSLDIRLVIPYYPTIAAGNWRPKILTEFDLELPTEKIPVKVYALKYKDVPIYLIDGEPVAKCQSVYSLNTVEDGDKFTFFSLAALELCKAIKWKPDILHANDWHTALAVYHLAEIRTSDPFFSKTRSLLSLHNLPFMGAGTRSSLDRFGIVPSTDTTLPVWGRELPLPMGLSTADAIVAVSPQYSKEILKPEYGCDLQGFLATRKDKLSGIINGLDFSLWDPANDSAIRSPFSIHDLNGKADNKKAVWEEYNFSGDFEKLPLLVLISRMDRQKGIDIALEGLRRILQNGQHCNWRAILLGSGDPNLEGQTATLAFDFPEQVRAVKRFDSQLSHRLYAGADILMMPSRYEACGLSQLIAMRYGCLPVARATGGLVDTIKDGKTGFLFAPIEAEAFQGSLERALALYGQPKKWLVMQKKAMQEDFSWHNSAIQYARLYVSLVDEGKNFLKR
ncbi:MAG TPA: glycogen/starch synthase [Longilinea sp.]|nr:glycogen/starch synthase [Longilinea sp.]